MPEGVGHRLGGGFHRRPVGHVEGDADGVGAEPGLGGLDGGGIAIPDRHLATLGDDALGDGEADAGRTAGDDRDAARKASAINHYFFSQATQVCF